MKNKKIIEKLKKEAQELNNQAYELENEEILQVVLPKLKNMTGWCMKNSDGNVFMKILEWGENKRYGFFFILERIEINQCGEVSLCITTDHPYTNKEWWDSEIPLYNVIRIKSEIYENKKIELLNEMSTRNKLKKFKREQK